MLIQGTERAQPFSDFSPAAPTCPPAPALSPHAVLLPGVSKIVTVDVKGSSPRWLKVKDLAEGMIYRFRIRAKTFTYGPEIEANVTTGPGEGRGAGGGQGGAAPHTAISPPVRWGRWSLEGTAEAWERMGAGPSGEGAG